MTLYREIEPGAFTPWLGEDIDGVRHPLNIADCWSAQELAAIGLYAPSEADAVPEGKVIVSTAVERVDGVVKFVHALEDAPPPTVPDVVSMRQARLALLGAGLLSQVEAAFDELDEPERSVAKIEWEYATELRRDHPLVASLASELSLTDQQVDDLFIAAGSIE